MTESEVIHWLRECGYLHESAESLNEPAVIQAVTEAKLANMDLLAIYALPREPQWGGAVDSAFMELTRTPRCMSPCDDYVVPDCFKDLLTVRADGLEYDIVESAIDVVDSAGAHIGFQNSPTERRPKVLINATEIGMCSFERRDPQELGQIGYGEVNKHMCQHLQIAAVVHVLLHVLGVPHSDYAREFSHPVPFVSASCTSLAVVDKALLVDRYGRR